MPKITNTTKTFSGLLQPLCLEMITTFYTQMSHSPTNTQEFLSGTAKEAHSEVYWSLPISSNLTS